MEIERIQQLSEQLDDAAEKASVLSTIDTLSDMFTRMARASKRFMLEGVRQPPDLTAAAEALRLLHRLGAPLGYDFPKGDDRQDVAAYVLRFGREIVFDERGREP